MLFTTTCYCIQEKDTSLYVASKRGNHQVVEVLIKAGADVNFTIKRVHMLLAIYVHTYVVSVLTIIEFRLIELNSINKYVLLTVETLSITIVGS